MIKENEKEERISHDMKIAVDEIIKAYPVKPQTILLCGGYGRGEGAWFYNKGVLSTYNDYDLAVISEYKLPVKEYTDLRKRIAKLVNINWIDIAFYKPNYFKHLKPTIKNVDLVYASKVIWGNDSFIKKCNVNSFNIGTPDILKLFKTRLWTFLGSWEGSFRTLDVNEARFFKNQMAKATLAACDVLLIKYHKYTTSYVDRVATITAFYDENQKFCNQAKWAIREKLEPSSESLSSEDMEKIYWDTKKIFLWAFEQACPRLLKAANSKIKLITYMCLHSDLLLHVAYEFLLKHSNRSKKVAEIFYAQVCVFLANDHGVINYNKIKEANEILIKYKYINNAIENWNELRQAVAFARNNV